ncbi:MAG: radical SAM family heme chaperone HemW [Bdellovibrio sp.]|nr:radical SAM family heme chaperone HemW [Bdellovibrio sp.]
MFRSIYAHFPFCESKCHYCDFYSLGKERTRSEDPLLFEKALRVECSLISDKLDSELETLFFGGGTPSMTAFDSMARAIEPLWSRTQLGPDTEWTMEANPSSVDLTSLRQFRSLGVNRISMGMQALRPDLLTLLGRVHSQEQGLKALETLFEAGFENVSVDLLCGVPGQSLKDVEAALQTLCSFPIQHLSCYLLTLPGHHKMAKDLPDEDTQLSHLLFVDEWMVGQGFEHYEISNYAKPGRKSKHNLRYWQGASYLGLGPSAHSYCSSTQQRWKNFSSLHKYATSLIEEKKLPTEAKEKLTPRQIHLESWMLALRLSDGFPLQWLESATQRSRAKILESQGLLENHPADPQRLRLTPRGFALSDQIIAALS